MPVTQSLPFPYTTGQTLTAKLFDADGVSDTVRATADSVTEATNRKGFYVASFTDVPAGDYILIPFLSGTAVGVYPDSSSVYRLTLTDGTFIPALLNVPTPAENAEATRTELATELARIDENVSAAKTLTVDYDAAKTAATQASVSALPDASANGTAAAAAIERADGMLKKVPKVGDQVRRTNQANKHVDETLSEVPE
jgi:hypothetical protein